MESFDAFADAATPWLLGLAHALTRNEHDAWDLTQDTLMKVLARWSRVEVVNPRGYARTTMVRLNVDRIRRLRTRRPSHTREEQTVEDPAPHELDEWLVRGLRDLSPHQRTAVVLRYAEDLGVEEIAAELGCSAGTVRSHLSRGLERLRRYADQSPDPEGAPRGPR